MVGVATFDRAAVRRIGTAGDEAGLDLRWVLGARTALLEQLATWRGRHARLHRDRTRAVVARGRLVQRSLDELTTRVAVLLATTGAVPTGATTAGETPPRVAGDPDLLREVARDGSGHVGTLRAAAAALDAAGSRPGLAGHGAEARAAASALRSIADAFDELDRWLTEVAGALQEADDDDRAALTLGLLGLAVRGPVRALASSPGALLGHGWADVPWRAVPDDELLEVLRWSVLPTRARDVVTRVLLARWAVRLDGVVARRRATAAARGRGLLDRAASLLDDRVLDPLDPVVHVVTDADEELAELARTADGLRALLTTPDVWLLDARPGNVGAPVVPTDGGSIGPVWRRGELAAPTVRLAIGDPARATHVAVVVAGTGTGVAGHATALADARALHARLRRRADPSSRVAVVLELYDAPADLARAADPRYATLAARELTRGLAALRLDARTTLVGHSYGAVTAGRAVVAGAEVDALVALGAPGLGVGSLAELPLPPDEVWAGRTFDDPIVLVGDVAEVARAAGSSGPLAAPSAAHGPDPAGPSFGARRLPTSGPRGRAARGHLEYLDEGTASLDATAAVVLGEL